MLRLLVLLLLLANAAYFAWSQGLLSAWGAGPTQQSEPQRLEQQILPDAIRILPPDDARRLESAVVGSVRAVECLQAGLFDDAEAENLRGALNAWPAASWTLEPGTESARWIVYMGKYAATDNVEKKKSELRQLGVSFEPVTGTALQPGLSLGGYATEAAARQQLEALLQKGVRTAKVVQERPEQRGHWLKFPAADDGLRSRLDDIRSSLKGRALRTCR